MDRRSQQIQDAHDAISTIMNSIGMQRDNAALVSRDLIETIAKAMPTRIEDGIRAMVTNMPRRDSRP